MSACFERFGSAWTSGCDREARGTSRAGAWESVPRRNRFGAGEWSRRLAESVQGPRPKFSGGG